MMETNEDKEPDATEHDKNKLYHQAFILKARQAVHNILFYLGLGYEPVGLSFLPFAEQFKTKIERSSPDIKKRIRAIADSVNWNGEIDADKDVLEWKDIKVKLSQANYPFKPNDQLIDKCEDFIKNTKLPSHFFNHVVPNLVRWGYKALTLALVAIGISIALWRIEQVRALFQNAGWSWLIPAVIFLGSFLLPWWYAAHKSKKKKTVLFWDFGGIPFRSYLRQARPPQHGFPFFGEDSQVPSLLLRRTLIITALRLLLIFLIILAAWLHYKLIGNAETNILTAVLVMSIFYILLSSAEVADYLDFFSRHPIRIYFIFIGVIIYSLSNIESGALWALIIFSSFSIYFIGRKIFSKTSRIFHPFLATICIILVIINGYILIGKPKKVWRDQTKIVERIPENEWPWASGASENIPVAVMATSGGGSRAAVYTALTLEALHADHPDVAFGLQCISSVSGGSLANAVYVARRYEKVKKFPEDSLVEAVNGDFILPTLYGLFFRGRGEQIEETWRNEPTKLGSIGISKLVTKWRDEKKHKEKHQKYPPFPLPLFNTSTLDSHDVVISPIAKEAYSPVRLTQNAMGAQNRYDAIPIDFRDPSRKSGVESQATWVFYRDGIYGLEDLLPKYNPDLAESVRASANFPFGFPLVRVLTTQPLYFNPLKNKRKSLREAEKEEHTVFLTDGGVLSNSGMWPLYRLLLNKAPVLRERGVLLIIVEASRMPEYPKRLKKITGLRAAINSRDPTGQGLHRRMIEMLQQVYKNRIEVVQIDLVPTEKVNIMTTWTLAKKHLDMLRESFQYCWTGSEGKLGRDSTAKAEIMHAWNRLKKTEFSGDEECQKTEYFGPRPPLN